MASRPPAIRFGSSSPRRGSLHATTWCDLSSVRCFPSASHSAHFRFRHRVELEAPRHPGSALSDFGDFGEDGALTPLLDWTIECLAYAARTTSSFPGAFEPARPFVEVPGDARTDTTTHLPVDFRGVSSETGAPDANLDGTVELIDGGVLDNIPISWAVRAIAAAPADRPVDRWLLYLQPVPPLRADHQHEPLPDKRRVTRLVKLMLRTSKIKSDTESLLDDAEEMRKAVGDAQRRAAIAAHALPTTDSGELVQRAQRELTSYRLIAGRTEGERLIRLLEDPINVVGPDPLPLPDALYPLRGLDQKPDSPAFLGRIRDEEVSRELARGGLDEGDPNDDGCEDAVATTIAPAPPSTDPAAKCASKFRSPFAAAAHRRALARLGAAIERKYANTSDEAVAKRLAGTQEWRQKIYAAALRRRGARGGARSHRVVSGERCGQQGPGSRCIRTASARLATLIDDEPMPATAHEPPSGRRRAALDAALERGQLGAMGRTLRTQGGAHARPRGPGDGTWADPSAWHEYAFDPLWQFLSEIALEISQANLCVGGFRAFRGMQSAAEALDLLASAEILVGPLRTDALSGSSLIGFATVSAANESPLEDVIFPDQLTDAERVSRKLSGNQVANFASFLSARWRATDWAWGRLDSTAVAGRSHARPERAPEDHSVEKLREMFVTAPHGPHADVWKQKLIDRWDQRQDNPNRSVNEENLAQRTIEVMTERLQWEILAEEMPLVDLLQRRKTGKRDRPPTNAELERVTTEHYRAARPERPAHVRRDRQRERRHPAPEEGPPPVAVAHRSRRVARGAAVGLREGRIRGAVVDRSHRQAAAVVARTLRDHVATRHDLRGARHMGRDRGGNRPLREHPRAAGGARGDHRRQRRVCLATTNHQEEGRRLVPRMAVHARVAVGPAAGHGHRPPSRVRHPARLAPRE